jgi:hypothetical protein
MTQLLEDAQSEFSDLRRVSGEKVPSPGDQITQGRERALQYLRGSADHIAALGPSLLGAVLAAVGPQLFNIKFAGCILLRHTVEVDGEFPDGFWERLSRQVTHTGAVSDMLAMFADNQSYNALLLDACYLSSRLMAEDKLRDVPFSSAAEKKKAADKSVEAPQPSETPAAAASTSTALTKRDVRNSLLAQPTTVREAGKMLLTLPVSARAMVIAGAFQQAVDSADVSDADHSAEISGRKLERALEETGRDQAETLRAMIEAGDIYVVLSMVRGEAGNYSSTAEHLDAELIRELFERDPDMHSSSYNDRLLQIAYTLVVETAPRCSGVNDFFNSADGQSLLQDVADMEGDEDAAELLRVASVRGITVQESWLPEDTSDEEGEGEDDDAGIDDEE